MKLHSILAFFKQPVFLLLIYVAMSFVLMSMNETSSLRGVRWLMLQIIEFVDDGREAVSFRTGLLEENEQLKAENFALHLNTQRLRETLAENARLRQLLNLRDQGVHSYITARIIGEGVERRIRSLILDSGSDDAVRKNMAVINADGLIGKVIETTPGQSIVQVLMDHSSLVSVRLQNSREKGVVSWSGNAWLDLLYVPKNIPVETGELVVTSGLSQIYPEGLKVGLVTSVEEDEFNLFKSIRIKSAVNFNALEEVFLIVPDSSWSPGIE